MIVKDCFECLNFRTQLPPEITLLEIIGGFGSNPILFTPATAKDMIQRHAPSEVETFETILNNPPKSEKSIG
jgi:hypothetical protein